MKKQTKDLESLLMETHDLIAKKRFDGQKHDCLSAITAARMEFNLLVDELNKPWYKRLYPLNGKW